MGKTSRLLGFTRKSDAADSPRISLPYLATIDLNVRASLYFEFWEQGLFFRRDDDQLDQLGKDALALDYFFKHEEADVPPAKFEHYYSAEFDSEQLTPACLSLLQLAMKARMLLLVNPRSSTCSFVIGTSREAAAILSQYFENLREVTGGAYAAAARGKMFRPHAFSKFTLPRLLGVEDAAPIGLPVPAKLEDTGVRLGDVLSPLTGEALGPATIALELLNRQTLVAGSTGGGKTNALMQLAGQVKDHASVLVLDPKGEHRSLCKTLAANVFGFGPNVPLFTFNMLKPVGPPDQWVKIFATILAEIISKNVPASGAKDVLIEELHLLFLQNGVYDGSVKYPTIEDLISGLKTRAASSERERAWIASALRVLSPLVIGRTRDAFCVREGLSLERFLKGVNVIELNELGDPDAVALVMAVLLQKLRNRLAHEPPAGLKHLIVLEEAQNVLAKGREAHSVITTTCREIRSFGVGMVYVTQMPSQFSENALSNVRVLLSFGLSNPADRKVMAEMLGIADANMLAGLEPGIGMLRTDKLLLVRVPLVDRPHVRDDELPRTVASREEVATDFAQRGEVQKRLARLHPRDWTIFRAVAEGRAVYPFALRNELGYSSQEASERLKKLMLVGFAGFYPVRKQGNKTRVVYFLTPMGEEAYRSKVGHYPDRIEVAATVQGELKDRVIKRFGLKPKPDPSRRFDILYDENGRPRAIEIETGSNSNAQLLTNVAKSVALQGEASFVVASETAYNRVLQAAARHGFDTRSSFRLNITSEATLGQPEPWDVFEVGEKPLLRDNTSQSLSASADSSPQTSTKPLPAPGQRAPRTRAAASTRSRPRKKKNPQENRPDFHPPPLRSSTTEALDDR